MQDKMQAQMLLECRLLQEQAKYPLLSDSPSASNTMRVQPNSSLHSKSSGFHPRHAFIDEFYSPRQINNIPVVSKAKSSVLSHYHTAQLEHMSLVVANQRYQSASAPQQLSPSALRFQQQQQMMSQATVNGASIQEVNYGGLMRKIYQVQFKCIIRYFTLAPGAPETLGNGDFVVVEADRGEDVGIVTEVMTMKSFADRRLLTKPANMDDEDSAIGKILRPACLAERQTLPEKYRSEESILLMSREVAYKTYQLPLQIHNVEYQLDRHKLTIYYTAEGRVDFRNFVRALFAAYKARIWMKKIDLSHPSKFQQSAAIALATGVQTMPELPINMLPPASVSTPMIKPSPAVPQYSISSMPRIQQKSPLLVSQNTLSSNVANSTMLSSIMHVRQSSSLSMPPTNVGTSINAQCFSRLF
jgi:hypothetical protein